MSEKKVKEGDIFYKRKGGELIKAGRVLETNAKVALELDSDGFFKLKEVMYDRKKS